MAKFATCGKRRRYEKYLPAAGRSNGHRPKSEAAVWDLLFLKSRPDYQSSAVFACRLFPPPRFSPGGHPGGQMKEYGVPGTQVPLPHSSVSWRLPGMRHAMAYQWAVSGFGFPDGVGAALPGASPVPSGKNRRGQGNSQKNSERPLTAPNHGYFSSGCRNWWYPSAARRGRRPPRWRRRRLASAWPSPAARGWSGRRSCT